MRNTLILCVLLAGCGTGQPAPSADSSTDNSVGSSSGGSSSDGGGGDPVSGWTLQSGGGGATLALAGASGGAAIRLICPAGRSRLIVNVPAFDAIASEERLSLGQGGEVVALVADTSGDAKRGGVTAEGAVPDELAALLSGPVSASYGSQVSGPHPVPPANLVSAFAAACTGRPVSEPAGQPTGSACLTGRDGRPLPANRIKAVGTEPFWAATVEGRCVTYMHPENQSGTRVWTEFSGTAQNGSWSGFLNERAFEMRTRPQPGCSDGMSDKRYPIAVNLTVNGEQRSGCAESR